MTVMMMRVRKGVERQGPGELSLDTVESSKQILQRHKQKASK